MQRLTKEQIYAKTQEIKRKKLEAQTKEAEKEGIINLNFTRGDTTPPRDHECTHCLTRLRLLASTRRRSRSSDHDCFCDHIVIGPMTMWSRNDSYMINVHYVTKM